MPEPIKAITVHQPWATLLALGEKEYETRGWATGYRGPIAIHAGRNSDSTLLFLRWRAKSPRAEELPYFQFTQDAVTRHFKAGIPMYEIFPLGAIVAVGELVAMHMRYPPTLTDKERAFGYFGEGRVAWQIANVRLLETPIPARGQQGLWEWTPPDGFVIPT